MNETTGLALYGLLFLMALAGLISACCSGTERNRVATKRRVLREADRIIVKRYGTYLGANSEVVDECRPCRHIRRARRREVMVHPDEFLGPQELADGAQEEVEEERALQGDTVTDQDPQERLGRIELADFAIEYDSRGSMTVWQGDRIIHACFTDGWLGALLSHIETLQQEIDTVRESKKRLGMHLQLWKERAGEYETQLASLERVREAVDKLRKSQGGIRETEQLMCALNVELARHEREHPKEAP